MWITLLKIEASLIKDFKLDNTTSGLTFISCQKIFGLCPQTFSQVIKSSPSGIIHYLEDTTRILIKVFQFFQDEHRIYIHVNVVEMFAIYWKTTS